MVYYQQESEKIYLEFFRINNINVTCSDTWWQTRKRYCRVCRMTESVALAIC